VPGGGAESAIKQRALILRVLPNKPKTATATATYSNNDNNSNSNDRSFAFAASAGGGHPFAAGNGGS